MAPAFDGVALVNRTEDFQRKLQAVDFFSVNGHSHIQLARFGDQLNNGVYQLFQNLFAAAKLIAGVQGREFDGDRWCRGFVAQRFARFAHLLNGTGVVVKVAFGIVAGACGFAQHVVRVGVAFIE